MTNKLKIILFFIFYSFFISTVFFCVTGLIPEWGKWYSSDSVYRLQTKAFLSGEIKLPIELSQVNYDLSVIDGKVQQSSGLGTPLIRLPFELVFGIFPDRLVLLFVSSLLCFVVSVSFYFFLDKLSRTKRIFYASIISLSSLFFLPIISLVRTRFLVYEETIFVGYNFALITILLMFLALKKKNTKIFCISFFLAMFLPFIRATTLFYSILVFLSLFVFKRRQIIKRISPFIFFALFSGTLFLFLNYERFGSPFELGHRTNLDVNTMNNYQLKYDYPFKDASLSEASKELFGALLNDGTRGLGAREYNKSISIFQSLKLRWRNYYSSGFTYAFLSLCLLNIIFFFSKKRKENDYVFFVTPITIFLSIFLFYLYSPSLSSRYINDFSASVFLLITIPFAIFENSSFKSNYLIIFLGVMTFGVAHEFSIKHSSTSKVFDYKKVYYSDSISSPKDFTFKSYELGNYSPKKWNFLNTAGWDMKSGIASSSVQFFIKDTKTLKVVFDSSCYSNIEEFEPFVRVGNDFFYKNREEVLQDEIVLSFNLSSKYQKNVWTAFLFLRDKYHILDNFECGLKKIYWE